MSEAIIKVEHLNKQFIVDKKPIQVLKDINLEVQKGEFITIVGHSGCGKSTLLKIICGLVGYEDGVADALVTAYIHRDSPQRCLQTFIHPLHRIMKFPLHLKTELIKSCYSSLRQRLIRPETVPLSGS